MSEQRSTPRPHQKLTAEGRRMGEVLSYSRRGSRFTPTQAASWEAHAEAMVIPDEAVDDPAFSLRDWFGREAPLVVDIGPGIGEATAALAASRPECDVLALEVWKPGIADSLWRVAEAGASNVRFCGVDAAWVLATLLGPGEVHELWTFFPDPWPKTRHHKRRLVDADFARLVAGRLEPGGTWRLATDWGHYAERMVAVLDAEPGLQGGVVERWDQRPVTRFERKGLEVGRDPVDLAYRAVPPPA